jgi:hypothetical protein
MFYPQNLATPYGATPYANTLNTLYGNVPQNPTLAQTWTQGGGPLLPQANWQQLAAQQLAQQIAAQHLNGQQLNGQQLGAQQPPFAAFQPIPQTFAPNGLAATGANGLLAGQPFAFGPQQMGLHHQTNLAPQQLFGQQQFGQQPLHQLAQYYSIVAQQLAQLAAQQQQFAPGQIANTIGGQMIPGQPFHPAQFFIPGQQFAPLQQFITTPFGQNVAPGMTLH